MSFMLMLGYGLSSLRMDGCFCYQGQMVALPVSFTSGLLTDWQLLVGFDAESAASRVPDEPHVWIDVSLVQDKVSGTCSSGSWFLFSSSWSSLG